MTQAKKTSAADRADRFVSGPGDHRIQRAPGKGPLPKGRRAARRAVDPGSLAAVRRARNLTQAQAAALLGTTQAQVS